MSSRFLVGVFTCCCLSFSGIGIDDVEGFAHYYTHGSSFHEGLRRVNSKNKRPRISSCQAPDKNVDDSYSSAGAESQHPGSRRSVLGILGTTADESHPGSTSRRSVLGVLVTTAAAAAASSVGLPQAAVAGIPELDSTGQLYSPKSEMLSGGSEAARGIPIDDITRRGIRDPIQAGQAIQNVYGTRFIAYLSRFLLNFDPSAHAWWLKRGLGDTWERDSIGTDNVLAANAFAEFAESVEVGLADYFVGPYGSYSSISAAKAGILASQPAKSKRPDKTKKGFFESLLNGRGRDSGGITSAGDSAAVAKQGILNLYTLLKARYSTVAAKRQLAILFSFIADPKLQPTREIAGLLGEADNATVTNVQMIKPVIPISINEAESRTCSRRGGGYTIRSFPSVSIDPPPALGDDYQAAVVEPVMRTTSRVLRIKLTDRGEGYTSAPQVRVTQRGVKRSCQAAAILDRSGHIDSILVLDPGYGYGGKDDEVPPIVDILPPSKKKASDPKNLRRAQAVAELEYEIVGVRILRGGNGYVKSEPPKVQISPPETDPDWYLAVQEQPELRMVPVTYMPSVKARVVEMRFPDDQVAFFFPDGTPSSTSVDSELLDRLQREPLALLPSSIRPEPRLAPRAKNNMIYAIPSMESIPQYVTSILSPRYRAYDPAFGGVGTVPVSKSALELSGSEYARLALSGALCTVLVRTALNPLELIKTKQQLLNDNELFSYARDRKSGATGTGSPKIVSPVSLPEAATLSLTQANRMNSTVVVSPPQATVLMEVSQDSGKVEPLGTLDVLQSLVKLRGIRSLWQSADITLLASIVFGSFGFGATELFRRSFSAAFFTGTSETGSEVVLLFAAAMATVITAAVASPFEILRVRSMGLLEPTGVKNVLRDFLDDGTKSKDGQVDEDFDPRKLKPKELLPLFSGFAPTLSRELPFAIAKFLTFDLIAKTLVAFLNGQLEEGALPIQVGIGSVGLAISAASGALAGITGAIVSHPADLILTKTSARRKDDNAAASSSDWRDVVKDLISKEGGISNLFVGLGARSVFFFLVIGLQFFLYDYVKDLFQVGSDDLSLVLDVFYAVRAGLVQ